LTFIPLIPAKAGILSAQLSTVAKQGVDRRSTTERRFAAQTVNLALALNEVAEILGLAQHLASRVLAWSSRAARNKPG
jgi:hypothetical protein